jgi:hypothetical protein
MVRLLLVSLIIGGCRNHGYWYGWEVFVKTLLLMLVIVRALFRSGKILKFISSCLQEYSSFDPVIILIIHF